MTTRRNTTLWTAFFVVLTLLSLDYWWWGAATRLSLLGLPTWIYYFVALQFVLAAGVFVFSRHYWVDEADDDGVDRDGEDTAS